MSLVKLCLLIVCSFAVVKASPQLRKPMDEQLEQLVEEIFKQKMDQQLQQLQIKNDELMAELASQKVQMDALVQALQNERGLSNGNRVQPSEGRSGAPFRTCHETRLSDLSLGSGMYWIDPDGHAIGDDPIYVYCDMTTGTTSILHDSEEMIDVGHCLDPGCYSKSIKYSATNKQIKAVVDLSAQCQQSIRYDCNNAPFYLDGTTYSWWNDRDGKQRTFWSGSGSPNHTCQCGIDGNCVDVRLTCNCDSLIPLPLSDIGVITNKNYLPISRLNFGRTQLSTSSGQHTLGRLTCSGSIPVNRMPTSCEDLWRIGHTLSGLYLIKAAVSTDTVYCNFAKQLTDSDFQTWLGTNVTKPPPPPPSVYFEMQRTFDQDSRGILTYDLSRVNIGDAMNPSTGIFTAPLSGTYFFAYSGRSGYIASDSTGISVDLKVNGVQEGRAAFNTNKGDHDGDSASVQSIVQLKQGDQVYMEVTAVNSAYLTDHFDRYTHFSGALLLPEDF